LKDPSGLAVIEKGEEGVVVDSPLIMLVSSQGTLIHKLTLSPWLLLKAVSVSRYYLRIIMRTIFVLLQNLFASKRQRSRS
jgi:hypothetical protein